MNGVSFHSGTGSDTQLQFHNYYWNCFLLETVLNNLILEFYSFKEFLAVAFNLFLMKKLIPLLLMYKCFICVYMFTVKW